MLQNNIRDEKGRFLPNNLANPTGVGGFQNRKDDINIGGRPKNEQRFGYWLQFFKDMTVDEFAHYTNVRDIKKMYMAEAIAYERVKLARKDLNEYKDLADRTEGKAVVNTNIFGDISLRRINK